MVEEDDATRRAAAFARLKLLNDVRGAAEQVKQAFGSRPTESTTDTAIYRAVAEANFIGFNTTVFSAVESCDNDHSIELMTKFNKLLSYLNTRISETRYNILENSLLRTSAINFMQAYSALIRDRIERETPQESSIQPNEHFSNFMLYPSQGGIVHAAEQLRISTTIFQSTEATTTLQAAGLRESVLAVAKKYGGYLVANTERMPDEQIGPALRAEINRMVSTLNNGPAASPTV